MSGELRIAELALLGQRTLASSEDAIAQVTATASRRPAPAVVPEMRSARSSSTSSTAAFMA